MGRVADGLRPLGPRRREVCPGAAWRLPFAGVARANVWSAIQRGGAGDPTPLNSYLSGWTDQDGRWSLARLLRFVQAGFLQNVFSDTIPLNLGEDTVLSTDLITTLSSCCTFPLDATTASHDSATRRALECLEPGGHPLRSDSLFRTFIPVIYFLVAITFNRPLNLFIE